MEPITTLTMNPAIDKSATVDRVTAGDKLRARHVRHDPGGGGINVSRAVAHLDGSSTAIFVSGGPVGTLLQQLLGQEAIEQVPIQVAQPIRENLTVVEDSSGAQYRFGMPGPQLSKGEIEDAEQVVRRRLSSGGYFVASGSLPPGVPTDFYARLATAARGEDARFIVDTSGEALEEAVHAGAFLIKPNVKELARLVNETSLEGPQIREAAEQLVHEGTVTHVVVSLGSAGAYFVSREGTQKLSSPTVDVQSRIGAGDSMVGGIVRALADGKTIHEAVRWGIAAGTAAVITPGTELCRREDTLRLLDEVS